jgi:hypothetical protein
MAEWQVQKSRDGQTWEPMQPRVEGQPFQSMEPGDHWFTDYEAAFTAGQHLRNALTWSDLRIIEREDGQIVKETPIL